MDGNGRWATAQHKKRIEGHRQGTETVDRLLDALLIQKISVVSLYAFSTENWRRPKTEVFALFKLLDEFISSRLEKLIAKGVRIIVSGNYSRLPRNSRVLIEEAILKTKKNKKLIANFCLNYGARDEIHRAAWLYAKTGVKTKVPSEKEFKKYLYTANLPDVDLVVRTAGEYRLSNFLLYQSAYAELVFLDKCWPDFNENDLRQTIQEFSKRKRNFGAI